jgi:hypothetical protein
MIELFHHLGRTESLQKEINSIFSSSNLIKARNQYDDPREIAWLESLKDTECGLWLEMAPKTSYHSVPNRQFQMALTLRLFLPQKLILSGTRCNCAEMKNHSIDAQGIHFATGCNRQGVRIQTHNRVRDMVATILRYCGIGVRIEERSPFRGADPENAMRSDITVFGIPSRGAGKYHIDIRITSPVPPNLALLTAKEALISFRAGVKSLKEKNRKYRGVVEANGMKFIPMVFEITGKMDFGSRNFLGEVLSFASEDRRIPFIVLWRYWISALMVCLQKNLMEGVQTRAFDLNGRGWKDSRETSAGMIREIDYLNGSTDSKGG